ncbi:MAG: hypothetical protein L0287_37955, partial [Anaerolineae bacterium]|nr:hypothetical protein [Anaerolineae bacterium]
VTFAKALIFLGVQTEWQSGWLFLLSMELPISHRYISQQTESAQCQKEAQQSPCYHMEYLHL